MEFMQSGTEGFAALNDTISQRLRGKRGEISSGIYVEQTTDPGITTHMNVLVPCRESGVAGRGNALGVRRPWMAERGERALYQLQVIVLIYNYQGASVANCITAHNGAQHGPHKSPALVYTALQLSEKEGLATCAHHQHPFLSYPLPCC